MSDQVQPSLFFRAFDIAFFVPGAVLFLAALVLLVDPAVRSSIPKSDFGIQHSVKSSQVSGGKDKVAASPLAGKSLPVQLLMVNEHGFSTLMFLQLAIFLIGSYVLGLICHAVSWSALNFFIKSLREGGDNRVGYRRVLGDLLGYETLDMGAQVSPRDLWTAKQEHYVQRADYFWYLRSTCWNTAFSVFCGSLMFIFSPYHSGGDSWLFVAGGVFVAFFLLRIGTKFGNSHEKRKMLCARLESEIQQTA